MPALAAEDSIGWILSAALTPVDVELIARPPEVLALLDAYLAGDIVTMEFVSAMESVRKKCVSNLSV